uniref:GGDEF domain-containing protein n=2 Tax=Oceanospirillaceae TaxID=135620 RepID=UPI003511E50E
EWEQAIRKKTPLSVILIEIDQFKRFSETFGPERANWVQARVGHILQNHQRRSRDLVARTGSAQFAVVLPITPNAIAYSLAEKMRSDVESLQIEHVKAHQVITISTSIITTSTSEPLELQDWIKLGYQQLNTAMVNNGNYSANCAPSSNSANASA